MSDTVRTPAIHATGLRKQLRQGDGTPVVAVDDVAMPAPLVAASR